MSRDVDALWQQLKSAQQAPSRKPGLSGFAGIPGITSQVRTYDKSRGSTKPAARPSFIAQLGLAGKGEEQQQGAAPGDQHALLVRACCRLQFDRLVAKELLNALLAGQIYQFYATLAVYRSPCSGTSTV